jgi:hypothetical protein
MIAGIVEKKRFEPFYENVECLESPLSLKMTQFSLPAVMTPPGMPVGSPPFGLYGSVFNVTSSCRNPNQVEITTKKADFSSTLYLPDMSKWRWGESENIASSGKVNGSYIFVASILLKEDYVLPADGTGRPYTETIGNLPLEQLSGLLQSALLVGYVPLYTKTVATATSCVKLFGIEFCDSKEATVWCGVLGGNCLADMKVPGKSLWVPGLCAMTRTTCRMGEKGEAEMKALVTAKNLGVNTTAMPCLPHTQLPSNMTCPVASAPGINKTTHQVPISGFVDGPYPSTEDLADGEFMINLATGFAIALGVLGCLCSGIVTSCALRRQIGLTKAVALAAPSAPQPAILTSRTEETKKAEVSAV